MRTFLMAVAATTMLGLGAAQAARPTIGTPAVGNADQTAIAVRPVTTPLLAAAGRSGANLRSTLRVQIADGDGSGADVRANRHLA